MLILKFSLIISFIVRIYIVPIFKAHVLPGNCV